MKEHLANKLGFVACHTSGRKVGQSKALVFGLQFSSFATIPETDRCSHCQKLFTGIVARRAAKKAAEAASHN